MISEKTEVNWFALKIRLILEAKFEMIPYVKEHLGNHKAQT